jgi:hypothetical protein
MARVNVKGVDELAQRLNRSLRIELNKLFRDKALRKQVGEVVVADIRKNVNFGEAADSTLKTREYLERFNTTDRAYVKSDIKAVFSGKLLADLQKNVKGFPTKSTFEIAHSSRQHPGYKTANGRTKKIDYTELSEYLIDDLGYNYIQLSEEAEKKILEIVQDKFFELLID